MNGNILQPHANQKPPPPAPVLEYTRPKSEFSAQTFDPRSLTVVNLLCGLHVAVSILAAGVFQMSGDNPLLHALIEISLIGAAIVLLGGGLILIFYLIDSTLLRRGEDQGVELMRCFRTTLSLLVVLAMCCLSLHISSSLP